MFIYAFKRLNLFVITLLILTLISYNIGLLDMTSRYHQIGYWSGWLSYLQHIMAGDLGVSAMGNSILQELINVLPATAELCIFALALALIIGIPFGTLAGINRGRPIDTIISSLTLISFSMPIFWLAILMMMLFSWHLGWLPVSNRYNLLFDIPDISGFAIIDALLTNSPQQTAMIEDILRHLVLPTLVLAIAPTTEIIKLLRDSVSEVITKNYVKAAATKGLSKFTIIRRHVLKNALPPIIPRFGMQISTMMTFAIITESIFNWPGIGTWLLNALSFRDYIAVQGGVLCVGSILLFANIFSDLLGAAINPLARKEWYALR